MALMAEHPRLVHARSSGAARVRCRPSVRTRAGAALNPYGGGVQPLCPLALSMLAAAPRDAGEVGREVARRRLSGGVPAARAAILTLGRLRDAGLVYAMPVRDGQGLPRHTRSAS